MMYKMFLGIFFCIGLIEAMSSEISWSEKIAWLQTSLACENKSEEIFKNMLKQSVNLIDLQERYLNAGLEFTESIKKHKKIVDLIAYCRRNYAKELDGSNTKNNLDPRISDLLKRWGVDESIILLSNIDFIQKITPQDREEIKELIVLPDRDVHWCALALDYLIMSKESGACFAEKAQELLNEHLQIKILLEDPVDQKQHEIIQTNFYKKYLIHLKQAYEKTGWNFIKQAMMIDNEYRVNDELYRDLIRINKNFKQYQRHLTDVKEVIIKLLDESEKDEAFIKSAVENNEQIIKSNRKGKKKRSKYLKKNKC
ncbi:MAG: hypothetical protein WA432_04445 [Candidatus Babeliaceae bacterium]